MILGKYHKKLEKIFMIVIIGLKRNNLDPYFCSELCKLIIDEVKQNLFKKKGLMACYSYNSIFGIFHKKYVEDFLPNMKITNGVLKMSNWNELTFFQDNVLTHTYIDVLTQIQDNYENPLRGLVIREMTILEERNKNLIFDRMNDDEFKYHVSYSVVSRVVLNASNTNNADMEQIFHISRGPDYISNFCIYDPERSLEEVYIRLSSNTDDTELLSHHFIWNEKDSKWVLNIFKPPYSPFFAVHFRGNCRIFFKKKFNSDIQFSSANHYLCSRKRSDIATNTFLSLHDKNSYLKYEFGEVKKVQK